MGGCEIPSGKIFNGGQVLLYLEWIKNNPWKRKWNEGAFEVTCSPETPLKFSLSMEINNCTKTSKRSILKYAGEK